MEAYNLSFGDFAEDALKGIDPSNADLTKQGMARLEVAAAGLPITLDELAVIFADDLQDFGSGAVSMDGIRQACQWYARGRATQEPDNRVTCTSYTPFDGNVTAFRRASS